MQLLKIEPPLYNRLVWMSAEAKARWEGPLQRIAQGWSDIERQLLLEGCREACQQALDKYSYEQAVAWAQQHDLNYGIIRWVRPWQGFAHRYQEMEPCDEATRVVVFTRDPALCQAFLERRLSDEEIGAALGYPACCRSWFSEVFPAYIDPVWQAALASREAELSEPYLLRLPQDCRTNSILRYVGVRLVPHLPCAFDCQPTRELASQVHDLYLKLFGAQLTEDLFQLLSMNAEWSALKGLCIVKTPLFQVCNGSIPCYPKHTVQLVAQVPDQAYPEGSVAGVVFPYRRTS